MSVAAGRCVLFCPAFVCVIDPASFTYFGEVLHCPQQCRMYSVADVAYATGPALLGAPRFYLDFLQE